LLIHTVGKSYPIEFGGQMNKTQLNTNTETPIETLARREFLKNSLLFSIPLFFGNFGLPKVANAAAFTLPTHGSTYINVKTKGAYGDGSHDDTVAIQKAINSLPSSGGTIYLPAGRYMINAVTGLRLKSNMLFQMAPTAELYIKSNNSERYYALLLLNVSNVEISGGKITGDRDRHTGSGGEWGMGIEIGGRDIDWNSGYANRIYVHDVFIQKCWGDGICIGGGSKDVEIRNVVCTQNRRQGLSITKATNVRVFDSEFSYTNGTAPECGVDIEPDLPAAAVGIYMENCLFKGNKKYGLLIYKNASSVTIKNCIVEENNSCGIVSLGSKSISLLSNHIRNNAATGLRIDTGTVGLICSQNTFFNNYKRLGNRDRINFTQTGWTSKIDRDILVIKGSSSVSIQTNYYQ
jgi:hypothetical protein